MATLPAFWARLRHNPILLKEVRIWSRSARTPIILGIYLSLLVLLVVAVYAVATLNGDTVYGAGRPTLGKVVFGVMFGAQMLVVCFLAPGLTAAAIASEHERQTFDLLRTTLLSAHDIVFGKLAVALAFTVVIILAGLPVLGVVFLLGGVALVEVLVATAIVLVSAFTLTSWGIFCSSWLKRAVAANIVGYLGMIVALVVLPFAGFIAVSMFNVLNFSYSSSTSITTGWEKIIIFMSWHLLPLSPIATVIASEIIYQESQAVWLYTLDISALTSQSPSQQLVVASPWWLFLILYTLFGLFWFYCAVRLVNRKER